MWGWLCTSVMQPTNLSKISQVHQGPEETPETFLERLIEVYKTYITLNPKAPEQWSAVSLAFVNQSAPDIFHKLKRLEGFEGKTWLNLSWWLRKCSINTDAGAHQDPSSCIKQSRGKETGKGLGRDWGIDLLCRKTNVSTAGSWVTGKMNALSDRPQKRRYWNCKKWVNEGDGSQSPSPSLG